MVPCFHGEIFLRTLKKSFSKHLNSFPTLSPIFGHFQYRFGVFFFIQKMQWVSKEASSSIWHSYIFHSPNFALSIEVRRVHCVIINTVVGGYYYLRNF